MKMNQIVSTVQSIARDPKGYWATHKVGAVSIKDTYLNFLGPLALISGLSQLIKLSFLGITIPYLGVVRLTIVEGLEGAIVSIVMTLLSVLISSFVLEKLAPKFGGSITRAGAVEFIALASCVSLLGQVFVLLPFIGWIVTIVASIYSIYIFWLGIPSQTGVAEAQRAKFVVVLVVVMFLVNFLLAMILPHPGSSTFATSTTSISGGISPQDLEDAEKLQKLLGLPTGK